MKVFFRAQSYELFLESDTFNIQEHCEDQCCEHYSINIYIKVRLRIYKGHKVNAINFKKAWKN